MKLVLSFILLLRREEEEKEEELLDPKAKGIDEAEVIFRKKAIINAGNKKLNKMMSDAIKGGETGQGLFTKLVFEDYFENVDV